MVADDRPGLLSAIAAALTSHRLDVITALVFSRTVPPGCEAVDLLWVRRDRVDDRDPIDEEEAVSIGEVLSAILAGRISVEEIASRKNAEPERRGPRGGRPVQRESTRKGARCWSSRRPTGPACS